jgi:hypothetical protein
LLGQGGVFVGDSVLNSLIVGIKAKVMHTLGGVARTLWYREGVRTFQRPFFTCLVFLYQFQNRIAKRAGTSCPPAFHPPTPPPSSLLPFVSPSLPLPYSSLLS